MLLMSTQLLNCQDKFEVH
uniref:Uncharacterized protein n=1 Tax=Anguilla anguilla TaxID=7936 RepID=A0A0E9PCV9_ANGAN